MQSEFVIMRIKRFQREGASRIFLLIRMQPRNVQGPELQQCQQNCALSSVADPNPNLDSPDPHVFGPPGSGSISQRYGPGSGSFYHQAKIVRKTLIPIAL